MPENEYAWSMIRMIGPGLFSGFGGMNYRAIEFVFELYTVPRHMRQDLFEKVIAFGDVAIEESRRKSK